MITYKYKLYTTHRTSLLDKMLGEACFVWNYSLALQKRYYKIYGKSVHRFAIEKHFAKRIKLNYITTTTRNEIIERLNNAYVRFFKHSSKRPPKFKKASDFNFMCFKAKVNGLIYGLHLYDDHFIIRHSGKKYKYKFFLSRPFTGKAKRVYIKRTKLGEYFIGIYTDAKPQKYGKSRNGASVGIDFGLKTYLTLSDGTMYEHPLFLDKEFQKIRKMQHKLDKSVKGSNNRNRKLKEIERAYRRICNKRKDYQFKLAHELCLKYDKIFIEDLDLITMNVSHKANFKIRDLAHAEFVQKLFYVASKYDVVVHKIDRYYPSSKTCTCGYVYKEQKMSDRRWKCPKCGAVHDRDLLAANNILRRGIVELESDSKTPKRLAEGQSRQNPTISS